MANKNSTRTIMAITSMSIIIFLTLFSLTTVVAAKNPDRFSETLNPKHLGLRREREKLTHLHFYFHEIVTARKPTSIRVASANTTNASPTLFGLVAMIDNALTVGPNRASKLVGWAQGMYGLASQSETMMLMAFTFVFTEGKYNGSSLSILGRNPILSAIREMPIIGGSGRFRFSSGYVEARTHTFEANTTGNAIVEYDVYALHY